MVEATSPTLVTPALGTPSALVMTNATGLPNSGVIGLVTAAKQNTGTSGATIPLLNAANTTFSGNPTLFTGIAEFEATIKIGPAPRVYISTTAPTYSSGCSSTAPTISAATTAVFTVTINATPSNTQYFGNAAQHQRLDLPVQ